MRVRHIDNSFFKLTAAQARQLSIENRLPKPGHEIKADPQKLCGLTLEYRQPWDAGSVRDCASQPDANCTGWILRTALSWWDGKPVDGGFVWAIRIHWGAR